MNVGQEASARLEHRRGAGCGRADHAGEGWVDKGCFMSDNIEQSTTLEIQRSFAIGGVSPRGVGARGVGSCSIGGVGLRQGLECGTGCSVGRAAAQHCFQATAQAGRTHPPERGLRAVLGVAAERGAPRLKPAVGRKPRDGSFRLCDRVRSQAAVHAGRDDRVDHPSPRAAVFLCPGLRLWSLCAGSGL